MKRILVPCDFRYSAGEAYRFALDIARKSQSEILVLHVIDLRFLHEIEGTKAPSFITPEIWNKLEKSSTHQFEAMRSTYGQDVPVQFQVKKAPITRGILEVIEEGNFDLVVMGSNGTTALNKYLIGTNTEKIARFSRVPVFTIRKYVPIQSIKNIVLPTGLELNQVEFMKHVRDLQNMFGAKLWLLTVDKPGKASIHQAPKLLEDFAKHYHLENYELTVREDMHVENAIMDFTEEIKADMIAMSTHSRKGLRYLVSGSIAESIVGHAACPIWTSTLGHDSK